jgi:Leucine-rich repeat (LRR) protein
MYAFGAFGDSTKNLIHQRNSIFKLAKKEILDDLSTLTKFYLNFEKYFTKSIELERIENNTFVNLKNLNELYLRCKSFDENVFYGMNKLKVLKLNYYNDDYKLVNKFSLNNNNTTNNNNQIIPTSCQNLNENISKNSIIFYEFKHLNDLRLLELSHASINVLKENSFHDLINLELLILYRCSINYIEPKAFSNLNNLKKLDMQHNNIEKLDKNVFYGLENLNELILNYCGIKFIEANAFADLANLIVLVIKNNELNYLKENTFNGLHNLKVLNISNYNESIKIFEENVFKDLHNLATLEISDMEIDELRSENLNDLTNLEELFCYGCSIKCINQNAFKNNSNLKVLNLSYNNIDIIKEHAFQGLINLEELDLSESNIKKVEDNVFNSLNSLINLDLAKTQIFSFGFGHEETTSSLKISNKKLDGIFQNVQVLDLSFNNFDCIDQTFFINFSNLNKLIISLHELNIFRLKKFEGLGNLDELIVLFSNDIQPIFDEDHFKNFTNLKKLVLSLESYYSCIQLIDEHTFSGLRPLKNLELFDLSKGWISHIEPNSFNHFPNLKHLNLSFNNLEILKDNAFNGLDNLQILDLSNCKIEQIESNAFNGLGNKLEKLDLQCFPIQLFNSLDFKFTHGLNNLVKILFDTVFPFY